MASEEVIAQLRRATALDPEDDTYTTELLSALIDELGFETAASTIWREKAASVVDLVDMTESGSTRRLSQLREGYLKMAETVGPVDTTPGADGASFTVGIQRV
jgi:hypothetical protein